MIRIDVFKKSGSVFKIEMDGHSGYSDGDDIVCAAASSVSYAVLNGMEKLANIKFGYEVGDGYLFFVLPDDLESGQREAADLLTKTFLLFVRNLESQYPEYVKVTELEV